MFKKLKFYKRLFILFFVLVALSLIISNYAVTKTVHNKVYNSIDKIPSNNVGLVLGTSKYLISGYTNAYYAYRIDATVKLYKANKINFILVSGDNGNSDYDEPTTMKEDLIEQGIPANKIFLDYAGFRTFDSVIRAHKVFGQNKITIISQKFHIERAIFIANRNNMEAVGFVASKVSANYGFKTMVREKFARVKLMLDIIFNKQPKFLGKKIEIK
jgi:SanA protein